MGKNIKCVVWDLDNTLWNGVLSEGDPVEPDNAALELIRELDRRGILQSISSKNDYDKAMQKLDEFGLRHFFLYPQIHWNPKSEAVQAIINRLNISEDTVAFIDDQPFERDEVAAHLPDVMTIDAAFISRIPDFPEMNPKFITEDSLRRREMYMQDQQRNESEQEFTGTKEEFLAGLGMVMSISEAELEDLQRAEELTVRTHQLNSTGITYDLEELDSLRRSPNHLLLIANLEDRYGDYGKIGLMLVECGPEEWTIKLLLMSCRVISRGVGTVMLSYIQKEAESSGVRLLAEFLPNERNRMMYATYKFAGFTELPGNCGGDVLVLEHDADNRAVYPKYMTIHTGNEGRQKRRERLANGKI
ncbi:HAD-IIIC family phosphatase [Paenibacillus sp. FSL H8-0122]|uniref:HAD-IIIC family phosphatase n=1 Tax=unclassified Paenibacillus TaxID=185978 RepID=UPI0030F658E3